MAAWFGTSPNAFAVNSFMKKLIGILLLCAMALAARAEGGTWLTDFAEAKKKARAGDKRLVMLFTGSDWCAYCIKWEKEVFSTTHFQDYAKANLVLLMVDFPEKKPLPKPQKKANDALFDKYKIEMYPTVVVLDSKGKKTKSFNYTEGGPQAFLGKLDAAK